MRALNKYVDAAAPWTLFKNGDSKRLGTVIHTLLNGLYQVAVHVWPVLPATAETLLDQLGRGDIVGAGMKGAPGVSLADSEDDWNAVRPGTAVAPSSSLFPRVEAPGAEKQPAAQGKKKKEAPARSGEAAVPPVAFADFQKLDLRVGIIREAWRHPNADKLLCFRIDLGEEKPRQILSGIAEHFTPDDLVGKAVIVVANLPPRTIRGLESQGMILTTESGRQLSLLGVSGQAAAGARVS